MPGHSQPEESNQTTIRVSIKISFPKCPLKDNYEYFEERRSESSEIVDALKRLEVTDYKVQYCMLVTGEPDKHKSTIIHSSYSSRSVQFALPPSELIEFGQFIVHVTAQISRSIVENKPTLDISADLANIIQLIFPIITRIMHLLSRDKERRNSKQMPTVTIRIGDRSVTVIDQDLKEAESTAKRITEQVLKEQPDAAPSNKVHISGRLTNSTPRSRSKAHNKRKR